MASISDGESGSSVRSKLNTAISGYVDWGASLNATGFSAVDTALSYYRDDGNSITMWVFIQGTSNGTGFTFDVPVAANAAYGSGGLIQPVNISNNGTAAVGRIIMTGGSATVTVNSTIGGSTFTGSGTKLVRATIVYMK